MNRDAHDAADPNLSETADGAGRSELDDLVFACLERMEDEGDAAIDGLCRAHPEHASALHLRIGALREAGLIESGSIAHPDSFPESLGEFRLLERLGGGGMGVVYLAEQKSLGRRVALKLIRPEQLYFPGARARFQREVEAVARLAHPNIVQVYTVGEEIGIPYFAMEEVNGASVADILRDRHGQDPARLSGADVRASIARIARAPGEATGESRIFEGSWSDACVRIVRLVADALEHAHRRGVLHRDIKPSNVMITPGGRVLLLDFGLATLPGTARLTRTGSQLGSLPYMSPEQLQSSAAEHGISSDVYSLGVTLYEMLTLHLPFTEPNSWRTAAGSQRPTGTRATPSARPRCIPTKPARWLSWTTRSSSVSPMPIAWSPARTSTRSAPTRSSRRDLRA